MSIHDTAAYCGRCGGKHTGRKGAHCKHKEPTQPATVVGDGFGLFRGPDEVNEFMRNEFQEGSRSGKTGQH